MTVVIGHLGKPGAGKGTVSSIFAELARDEGRTLAEVRFSDPLRETFKFLNAMKDRNNPANPATVSAVCTMLHDVWDIAPSVRHAKAFIRLVAAHFGNEGVIAVDRPNLQKLPVMMQPVFGENVLSHAVFHRAKARSEDLVQVDGMRWPSDEEELHAISGALLVYTKASFPVRAKRMTARMRDGEEKKTLGQLWQEDNAKNEAFVEQVAEKADFVIENELDSLEILRTIVVERYKRFVRPRLIRS